MPIHVTGHSLGAAIAALCAFDLYDNGYNIVEVYTFGQPRVGDATFAKNYNERFDGYSYRVVHYADIVPHLPPELLDFTHGLLPR